PNALDRALRYMFVEPCERGLNDAAGGMAAFPPFPGRLEETKRSNAATAEPIRTSWLFGLLRRPRFCGGRPRSTCSCRSISRVRTSANSIIFHRSSLRNLRTSSMSASIAASRVDCTASKVGRSSMSAGLQSGDISRGRLDDIANLVRPTLQCLALLGLIAIDVVNPMHALLRVAED